MTAGSPANATPEPDHDFDGGPGITVDEDGSETWIRNISGTPLILNGPVNLGLWSTIEDFRTDEDGHPDVTIYDWNDLGTNCVVVVDTDLHIDNYNGGVADWVSVDVSLGNITHTFPVGRQLRLRFESRHQDLWIAASGTRPSRLVYTVANVAPMAVNDSAPTILEDAATTIIDVLANDTDTNLDTGSVTIATPPAKGTATALPDGTINYQPTPDENGVDNFTYQVCDTGGLCAIATVTITVTPINDQPALNAGPDITVNAADPPFAATGWAIGITAGAANEFGQSLVFSVTAADPTLFSVQPSLSPTGTLTFTPSGISGTPPSRSNSSITAAPGTAATTPASRISPRSH